MMSREDEVELFKTKIPLALFAVDAFGYHLDKRKSSRNSSFLRNTSTGSKIVVNRMSDGHWTYWSISDFQDKGSIIDFTSRRTGENLGFLRKRLRGYCDGSINLFERPAAKNVPVDLIPITQDLTNVRYLFETTLTPLPQGHHKYLIEARGIIPAMAVRFSSSLFTDDRSNICMIHRDRDGVTGWETRNFDFKGFMPRGGYKSLWFAGAGNGDRKSLVIAESAFDAMAYAVLFPDANASYLSTGGGTSPLQCVLLTTAIKKLPVGGDVRVAADNDPAGQAFSTLIAQLLEDSNRDDLRFHSHPPDAVKDWNDHLLAQSAGPGKATFEPS